MPAAQAMMASQALQERAAKMQADANFAYLCVTPVCPGDIQVRGAARHRRTAYRTNDDYDEHASREHRHLR